MFGIPRKLRLGVQTKSEHPVCTCLCCFITEYRSWNCGTTTAKWHEVDAWWYLIFQSVGGV